MKTSGWMLQKPPSLANYLIGQVMESHPDLEVIRTAQFVRNSQDKLTLSLFGSEANWLVLLYESFPGNWSGAIGEEH
jgi:hypothetical protein